MSETSNGDVFTRNPTTTITTGLTTFCEVFAGLIKDDTFREGAIALTPIIVLGVVILLRNWKRHIETNRGERYYNKMISDLQEEKSSPTTTTPRKREIDKEIRKHRTTLEKLKADNIKIIVG
jgi:hypothetical protein